MKGLLIKDLHVVGRSYALLVFLFIALSIVIFFVSEEQFRHIRILSFFAAMFFVSIISSPDSEKDVKWNLMESALPINKKSLVNEKFLLSIVFAIIIIAVGFGVLLAMKGELTNGASNISGHVDYSLYDVREFMMVSFFLGSLIFIVTMTNLLAYDLGSRIGMLICGAVIVVICYMVPIILLENEGITIEYNDIWSGVLIAAVLWIVILGGTYIISRIRIKKREYI